MTLFGCQVGRLALATGVLDPMEFLLELLPAGLGITMLYLTLTTGMLTPMEFLLELLPSELRNSISHPSTMINNFYPGGKSCDNTDFSHSMEVPMQIFHSSNSCEMHVATRQKIVFLPAIKSELDPGGIDYGDQDSIQESLPNGYGFDTLHGDYNQDSI